MRPRQPPEPRPPRPPAPTPNPPALPQPPRPHAPPIWPEQRHRGRVDEICGQVGEVGCEDEEHCRNRPRRQHGVHRKPNDGRHQARSREAMRWSAVRQVEAQIPVRDVGHHRPSDRQRQDRLMRHGCHREGNCGAEEGVGRSGHRVPESRRRVASGRRRTAHREVMTQKPSGHSTRTLFSAPRAVTRQAWPKRSGNRACQRQTYG